MLALFRNMLAGGGGETPAPAPAPLDRLPAELVAGLNAAVVTFRPTPDETGAERVYVAVPTVGSWRHEGTSETAAKIAAAWPELNDAQARRAAVLLAGIIGQAAQKYVRGARGARGVRWMDAY